MEFTSSPRVSVGFLTQSKDKQVRWIGNAKLAVGVNACVCVSAKPWGGLGKTWQPTPEKTLPKKFMDSLSRMVRDGYRITKSSI